MTEEYSFLPGRIYENIRLFRTQDIDHFDVIIYIEILLAAFAALRAVTAKNLLS
jgi:hypothetical protein